MFFYTIYFTLICGFYCTGIHAKGHTTLYYHCTSLMLWPSSTNFGFQKHYERFLAYWLVRWYTPIAVTHCILSSCVLVVKEKATLYWGTYRDNHTSYLSHLRTFSSYITVTIGENLLSSFFIFTFKPKISLFHFFTVNSMVLSRFPKDQHAPPCIGHFRLCL